MPPVPERSSVPAGRAAANDYDSFAEAYTAETEANLINGYYMRPAIVNLAGDVAGRRILDAGCGSGPIAAALRDRGATVTGFDSSTGMLELARRRLGPDADLHQADLASPDLGQQPLESVTVVGVGSGPPLVLIDRLHGRGRPTQRLGAVG